MFIGLINGDLSNGCSQWAEIGVQVLLINCTLEGSFNHQNMLKATLSNVFFFLHFAINIPAL